MIYIADTKNCITTVNVVTNRSTTVLRWTANREEDLPVVTDRAGRRHAITRITLRIDSPPMSLRVTLGGVPVSKRNSKLLATDNMIPTFLDLEDPVGALIEATRPVDGHSSMEGINLAGRWIDHTWFAGSEKLLRADRDAYMLRRHGIEPVAALSA